MCGWLDNLSTVTSIAIFVVIAAGAQVAKMLLIRRSRSKHGLALSLRMDVPQKRIDPARWHLAHTVFRCGLAHHSKALARLFSHGLASNTSYDALFLRESDRSAPITETPAESMKA